MAQGRDLLTTNETITDAAVTECRCRMVPAGTLVVSFKLSIGKVSITQTPMYTNEAIAALRFHDPSQVDLRYMYHALRNLDFSRAGERAVKGLTLNLTSLGHLRVPVPPPQEQLRIAALLDSVDNIRQMRRESLQLLGEFLRSAYLDMFGDPVRNEKGWLTAELRQLGRVATGSTPPTSNGEHYAASGLPFVRPADLGRLTPIADSDKHVAAASQHLVEPLPVGAVLFCGIGATIGKTGITGTLTCVNQQIHAVIPSLGVLTSEFLFMTLRLSRSALISGATATTLPILKKSEFERYRIPAPPPDLQQDYSALFKRTLGSRRRMDEAQRSADRLFDALADRAFRGEL